MKQKILVVTAFLMFFSGTLWAGEAAKVHAMVQDKIGSVIGYLKDPALSKPIRNKKIIEAINPIFDFKIMAKVSLGKRHWRSMSPAQRKEFVTLFVQRLKESYLEKLDLYTDEDVAVEDAVQVKSRIHVTTYLVTKIDKKEMIYKFYKSKGQWKIYDVQILGVSIVQTYRSQFRGLLRSGGIEPLLAKLRESGNLTTKNNE